MILLKKASFLLVALLFTVPLMARNVFLEFQGGYFLPTNDTFRQIYSKGRALYGPELTVQLCNEKNWYAFASFDYLKMHGHSVGLCASTTVKMLPFSLGVKYFSSIYCDCFAFYAGLGLEGMNVRTKDCLTTGVSEKTKWGVGGIAKVGGHYYLPHNFLIDIFINYSFLDVGSNKCSSSSALQSRKAHVSGTIFGAGLGYRF